MLSYWLLTPWELAVIGEKTPSVLSTVQRLGVPHWYCQAAGTAYLEAAHSIIVVAGGLGISLVVLGDKLWAIDSDGDVEIYDTRNQLWYGGPRHAFESFHTAAVLQWTFY